MTNLFARIYALDNPDAPLPPGLDISSREPSPVNAENLQPVKNWSHPFRDKRDPLMQLTHLAKAGGGFYPLAGNGLWHGGVHFDGGTAGTGDQSSVHCLADGEVVAYRIDTLSPTTTYWINKLPVRRPFSRNFVLVRHRLQAPAIEGSKDTPPSLIFYSLYMHLQDWVQYDTDPTIPRPPFWSEGSTRYVKDNVNDERVGHPGVKGLNIRHVAHKGQVIGLLPRGAKVQVSGEGAFRRLENTPGPEHLIGEDGALRGYVAAELLEPIPGGLYRVNTNDPLNIRPQPDTLQAPIGELFRDTEVAVSGTGTFLKLERINQYVHYDSLQGKQEPKAFDSVVVLDKPVPIKAGDLIGHIGIYQEAHADRPEHKLHLEVFTSEPVEPVIKRFRTWESKLPASGRTWLKLVKGTPVVRHQERYSAEQPPSLHHDSTPSDGQLLVPKSLLDGLPTACKIAVPEKDGRKACNWYRLDKLLHDASQTLLDGWVREEVGVTPWVSPWAWEGFDTLFNFDPPEHLMASFMRATGRLNDVQRARYRATADRVDKGPIQERLYDLIDRNRDGRVTGSEIQTALNLPAHAQSIAQLIVHSDSEWHHTPRKWDALDELLGHSGSTPNRNWLAEKERIREMSWWGQVAPGVGLPGHGGVYHLHPVGLLSAFKAADQLDITAGQLRQIFDRASDSDIDHVLAEMNGRWAEFKLDSRSLQRHFFAQIKGEVGRAMMGVTEDWEFSPKALLAASSYYRANPNEAEADGYLKDASGKIIRRANQREIGRKHFQRLNGNRASHPDDGYIFRGRGLIQITGYEKYSKFMRDYPLHWDDNPPSIVQDPELVNKMPTAIRTAMWFWVKYEIHKKITDGGIADVARITRAVNGGNMGLKEREEAFEIVEKILK
ncbi:hypothetical protein [Pseudomonas sp. NPDC090201]|uniref:hypothetical protein n=1 Tax=Pseudomonas sp. NPDC090201 TaxID=3364475 RepID=UPI003822EDCB